MTLKLAKRALSTARYWQLQSEICAYHQGTRGAIIHLSLLPTSQLLSVNLCCTLPTNTWPRIMATSHTRFSWVSCAQLELAAAQLSMINTVKTYVLVVQAMTASSACLARRHRPNDTPGTPCLELGAAPMETRTADVISQTRTAFSPNHPQAITFGTSFVVVGWKIMTPISDDRWRFRHACVKLQQCNRISKCSNCPLSNPFTRGS